MRKYSGHPENKPRKYLDVVGWAKAPGPPPPPREGQGYYEGQFVALPSGMYWEWKWIKGEREAVGN